MALQERPLHPRFAAELSGVDLREIDDDAIAAVRSAAVRHGVVVFRDQPLDNAEQIAFAARLDGQVQTVRGRSAIDPSHTQRHSKEIVAISNLDDDGTVMERGDRRLTYGLANRLWHTDASFQDPPGRFSMLSAKIVPPSGGETEYAHQRSAYDDLPADRKSAIDGLRAHHSIAYSRMTLGFEFTPEELAALAGAPQPLVRTLPETGRKTLYLASHISHVIGMPVPQGRLLVRDLTEFATQPRYVYEHVWRTNDFVIWDNRQTMHRGRPYDETQHRDLLRVTTLDLPLVSA